MVYKNANHVLPEELILVIQQHIDGEYLYIPRKEENKKGWGELRNSKTLLEKRNETIFMEYQRGTPVQQLANTFYLSPKTVYKILAEMKKDR
ncbi:DNA-binding response regulator [Aminipila butyrica]|uniref:DNA-binding response regulator n=1 Tax=Aminipila butyrica TaxID=433296 RepID=A0A858BW73_9FIRM|nr:CD3324 family protein [Aminipila butyrica]QIB69348.1 DNA-binding response regulator [Aminipila butyrica]